MPIYEYSCHDCGKVFDAMQKFSDAPLTECRCGKASKVTKNLTAAGFALKGSGWYATDFKGGGAAGKTGDAKPDATAGAAAAPASTEGAAGAASAPAASSPAPACGAGACGACS